MFDMKIFLCLECEVSESSTQYKRLEDVELPPWARNDTKVFLTCMREALESHVVSLSIHHWIDLIFGYLQVTYSRYVFVIYLFYI